jgi:hypothetical protein
MKKILTTEKEVLKAVINKLKNYEFQGILLYWVRLQSGVLGDSWGRKVRLATAGTPDLLTVFRKDDGGLAVLFIEVKKPGVTKLRYEQREFFLKQCRDFHCVVINDPSKVHEQVIKVIEG